MLNTTRLQMQRVWGLDEADSMSWRGRKRGEAGSSDDVRNETCGQRKVGSSQKKKPGFDVSATLKTEANMRKWRNSVSHWAHLMIANMELKFLHSRQCRAILMKCFMVFILFMALGSFRISEATQKVSWFITSSNCFRLPLPVEDSNLYKSSTYL